VIASIVSRSFIRKLQRKHLFLLVTASMCIIWFLLVMVPWRKAELGDDVHRIYLNKRGTHLEAPLRTFSVTSPLRVPVSLSSPRHVFDVKALVGAVQQSGNTVTWKFIQVRAGAPTVIDGRTFPLSLDLETEYAHYFDAVQHADYKLDTRAGDELYFEVTTTVANSTSIGFAAVNFGNVGRYRPVISGLILVTVYVCITFNLVHRTLAALIGSLACLIVITSIEEAPTMKMVVSYIEETTMCLLFAMMIIVDCVAATGALHVMAVSS